MENLNKIKQALDSVFPTIEDQAAHFGTLKKDVVKKVNTVENKLKWIEDFIKPLGLTVKIEEDEV